MDERIGFGLFQCCGNRGGVGRVSVCVLVVAVQVGIGPGSGGAGWCYVVVSLDFLCRWQVKASEVQPVFNPVAPYGYLLPNMYFDGGIPKASNSAFGNCSWEGKTVHFC